MDKKKKIVIFGSCVSRDIFNLPQANHWEIVNYFARTSFTSIYSPIVRAEINLEAIDSEFQKRIVGYDIHKDFSEKIGLVDFDILLLDFIDERFDIFQFSDDSICVLSNELMASGFNHKEHDGKLIKSGTQLFFDLWKKGWDDFIAQMSILGLLHKVRLHQTYWASEDDKGEKFGSSMPQEYIQKNNLFLKKLYKYAQKSLEEKQILSCTYGNTVSASTHQWGRSPFHFPDAYYSKRLSLLEASYSENKDEMTTQKAYDPYALHYPVYTHENTQQSIEKNITKDGIHRIHLEKGHYLDLYIRGIHLLDKQENRTTLVGFSGAVSNRQGKRAPFFSGLQIAMAINLPIIAVADPSMVLHEDLPLSWYEGHQGIENFPKKLAAILDVLAEIFHTRLLLLGGSGGGYACLAQASLLHSPASVLVWNPQTDIDKYLPEAVNSYKDIAYPNTDKNFSLSVKKIQKNIQVLYMINKSDEHHVKEHMLPYLGGIPLKQYGNRTFINNQGNFALYVGEWGEGHAVPPYKTIAYLLSDMVSYSNIVQTAWALDSGQVDNIDPQPNLTHFTLEDNRKFPYELTFSIIDDTLSIVNKSQIPDDIEFASYLLVGGEKIDVHRFGKISDFEFSLPETDKKIEIVYFAKDLLDYVIYTQHTIKESNDNNTDD